MKKANFEENYEKVPSNPIRYQVFYIKRSPTTDINLKLKARPLITSQYLDYLKDL